MKVLEDVQVGKVGFGFVQVVQILPAPAKRLPFCVLDAASIDAAFFQHVFVFGSEVFADNGDDANVGEIAGGKSKVGRSAAENVLRVT